MIVVGAVALVVVMIGWALLTLWPAELRKHRAHEDYLAACMKQGVCGMCSRDHVITTVLAPIDGFGDRIGVKRAVYVCKDCNLEVPIPEAENRRRVQDAIADKIAKEAT